MKETSCWIVVVACCLILALEAPLVLASLVADLDGAYPAWESAEAPALGPESSESYPRPQEAPLFIDTPLVPVEQARRLQPDESDGVGHSAPLLGVVASPLPERPELGPEEFAQALLLTR